MKSINLYGHTIPLTLRSLLDALAFCIVCIQVAVTVVLALTVVIQTLLSLPSRTLIVAWIFLLVWSIWRVTAPRERGE